MHAKNCEYDCFLLEISGKGAYIQGKNIPGSVFALYACTANL